MSGSRQVDTAVHHPRLLGLGTATPAHGVTQADAVRLAAARCCRTREQTRLLSALYRMTRVHRRGSVLIEGGDTSVPHVGNGRSRDRATADTVGDGDPAGLTHFFPPPAEQVVAKCNGHGDGAEDGGGDRGPGTAARMAAYARLAPPLACRAAGTALAEAELSGEQITHLVTVSCTGFRSPGVDLELVDRLKVPPSVQRVNVGFMGCHGAMNGLSTARALAAADGRARVLLCCVELCSLHFQYGWDEQQLVANALFADGAAAMVIGGGAEDATAERGAEPRAGDWRLIDTASCVLPDSADQMTWEIDDHGFVMTLSPQVPQTLIEHVRPWVGQWLAGLGLSIEAVDGWAVHPGGPRILAATRQALSLPDGALAASEKVLREHGNMSSPTVLFIFEQLRRQTCQRPAGQGRGGGAHCVLLSFGPGLTGEAALLRREG